MTPSRITVEWHPSPYGLPGEVPAYRCWCGRLHTTNTEAHGCTHPTTGRLFQEDS